MNTIIKEKLDFFSYKKCYVTIPRTKHSTHKTQHTQNTAHKKEAAHKNKQQWQHEKQACF